MNRSTAANIARQARASAAAVRRMSKAAALRKTCTHADLTHWIAGIYEGDECQTCGANLNVKETT